MGAMAADGAPTAKKQKKVKQPIEAVPEGVEAHAGHSRLARALGSVDWHTREKGVQALTRFLQRKTQLPERDMLKIWKGLFYAFWHSDKAPVQVGRRQAAPPPPMNKYNSLAHASEPSMHAA